MSLTACETLFGAKGVPHYPPRTASIETRSNEEVFTAQYEVLFSQGLQLEEDSAETIAHLADIIGKSKPTQVRITGHTDSYGNPQYNKKLSLKRAQSVARKIKAHGVDTKGFIIEGVGQDDPAVPTMDGAKLLDNRRVVVELKK